MPIRIVIADDHELLREGIRSALAREEEFQVVAEAADGQTVLKLCRELQPDVLLLDMRLPDLNGVEVCRRLQQELPEVSVLILSAFADPDLVLGAVQAGAKGYLVKDVASMDLRRDIRAVARGEVVMDSKVVGYLISQMRQGRDTTTEAAPLNKQQKAIVGLVAQGYTNREIAEKLFLSEKTVKGYLAAVLKQLGVRNRVEAAMLASRQGWI